MKITVFCCGILAIMLLGSSDANPAVDYPLALWRFEICRHDTTMIVAPDGMVYLVDIGSGKVIWSFSSGPSIYSSFYPTPKLTYEDLDFYLDCGDDWELYIHQHGFGKMKFPHTVDELIIRSPILSYKGGELLTGLKTSTIFVVDGKTGRVVRTFGSHDLAYVDFGDSDSKDSKDEKLLFVTRTDYIINYTSTKTGQLFWYLRFAKVDILFPCEGREYLFATSTPKCTTYCAKKPHVHQIRDGSSLSYLFSTRGVLSQPRLSIASDSDQHAMTNFVSTLLMRLQHWYLISYACLIFVLVLLGVVVWERNATHQKKDPTTKEESPEISDQNKEKKGKQLSDQKEEEKEKQISEDKPEQTGEAKEERPTITEPEKTTIVRINTMCFDQSDSNVIGIGSSARVYAGEFQRRTVAIKRLYRSDGDLVKREVEHLIASDRHANIVKYYGEESDELFRYICLERCTCTLYKFISRESSKALLKEDGVPSSLLIKLMRDIVSGVAHLHHLRIIHRDLNPQNVLVLEHDGTYTAKISDMGISRKLKENKSNLTQTRSKGTSGWQAKEVLDGHLQAESVDLFSMGCILYFCLTEGNHPFGMDENKRDSRIRENEICLDEIAQLPEAKGLISPLLSENPKDRKTAEHILLHPFFWDADKRLSFYYIVSSIIVTNDPMLISKVNNIQLSCQDRKKEIDPVVLAELQSKRSPFYTTAVKDLIRLIRNTKSHYIEMTFSSRKTLGECPGGVDKYFSTHFPNLFMDLYEIILADWSKDKRFEGFVYRDT